MLEIEKKNAENNCNEILGPFCCSGLDSMFTLGAFRTSFKICVNGRGCVE